MTLETEIVPFWLWLGQHIGNVGLAILALCGLSVFLGFVASSFRQGPIGALHKTVGTLSTGLAELFQISPRRVLAIARLSFKESIRRRVYVVFLLFVLLLMFAGWFLDRDSQHPAQLYLDFVFFSTSVLTIVLSIFLSAFSIPNDVKNKTIYTVVTKPVRGWEIVSGRMLGFCAVGTVLIVVMCVASLLFVERGLRHTHRVAAADFVEETIETDDGPVTVRTGESSLSRSHRHQVSVREEEDEQGNVVTRIDVSKERDHRHQGAIDQDGNVSLGDYTDILMARVPVLGKLRFLDSSGRPGDGVNVGYEWQYRKYIEGGTLAAAIWRFRNIREQDFRDGVLPLEMNLRVFRTYKGSIESGLTGTIQIVRPAPRDEQGRVIGDGGVRSIPLSFSARDQEVYELSIPRRISAQYSSNFPDPSKRGREEEVDIFNDLAVNGELEIWVQCLDRAQYFGMAPADLYLRASNRPFRLNFLKGYLGIWFQMVIVTCFGVMFSTFLNGAVSMLATISCIIVGFYKQVIFNVASGEIPGGGPLESAIRLVTQLNQMIELDKSIAMTIVQSIDKVLMHIVQGVGYAMPDCSRFNTSNFVAHGYNVPADVLSQNLAITSLYVFVLTCAAYFFFKTREIAA